eukprot:GHVU01193857.1.p1 GENE.GHVU01193857.1~~GHVU01193857.1.p1  ORF type:complete len:805 (+),score=60.23 GHVU01193857.1:49-2415(+)
MPSQEASNLPVGSPDLKNKRPFHLGLQIKLKNRLVELKLRRTRRSLQDHRVLFNPKVKIVEAPDEVELPPYFLEEKFIWGVRGRKRPVWRPTRKMRGLRYRRRGIKDQTRTQPDPAEKAELARGWDFDRESEERSARIVGCLSTMKTFSFPGRTEETTVQSAQPPGTNEFRSDVATIATSRPSTVRQFGGKERVFNFNIGTPPPEVVPAAKPKKPPAILQREKPAPGTTDKVGRTTEPWHKLRKRFRLTVDLRGVNRCIQDSVYPFPDFEDITPHLAGAQIFGLLDLVDGYTQCPLHPDSQELMSLVTRHGVFTPTRVPQGASCSVGYFQATMEECFAPLIRKGVLVYLDDILLYAKTYAEYLDVLDAALRICEERNLKISVRKSELVATEVKWCGKIISASGIRHAEDRISALINMPRPKNGRELYKFLSGASWMRTSIPVFAEISSPLRDCMETVKKKAGSTKKTKCQAITVDKDVGWEEDCDQSFVALKEALCRSVCLAHPHSDRETLVFTDASERHWGAIITQVDAAEWDRYCEDTPSTVTTDKGRARSVRPVPKSKDIANLHHFPLAFASGTFKGAQERWSVAEKEAFAIKQTLLRFEHLLYRNKGFVIFTDHRNLTYILGKDPAQPLPLIVRDKMYRWYLRICSLPYDIRYIEGEDNVWADILSRWGAVPEGPLLSEAGCLSALQCSLPHPDPDEVVFPSLADIKVVQDEYKRLVPSKARHDEVAMFRVFTDPPDEGSPLGPLWLPKCAEDLKIRILVIAHARDGLHASQNGTLAIVAEHFW